jgi:hypothetical protein
VSVAWEFGMFDSAERSFLASLLPTLAAANGADCAASLAEAEDDVDLEAGGLSNAGWMSRMCVSLYSCVQAHSCVSLVANTGKGSA